jgi:hypothetical protein
MVGASRDLDCRCRVRRVTPHRGKNEERSRSTESRRCGRAPTPLPPFRRPSTVTSRNTPKHIASTRAHHVTQQINNHRSSSCISAGISPFDAAMTTIAGVSQSNPAALSPRTGDRMAPSWRHSPPEHRKYPVRGLLRRVGVSHRNRTCEPRRRRVLGVQVYTQR